MNIFRQHGQTELHEIIGKVCKKVLAIPSEEKGIILALYLMVDEIWLRVFIQAELLFVDQCDGPDPEDDLADGEEYLDIGLDIGCEESEISSAVMMDGVFKINFSNQTVIVLSEAPNGTMVNLEKQE